jgi:hypothetical protein
VCDPGGPLPGPYLVTDVRAPAGFRAAVAAAGPEPFSVRTRSWPGRPASRAEAASYAAVSAAARPALTSTALEGLACD